MPSDAWLGIHSSMDLGGRCRFGPDLQWVDTLDYDVATERAEDFYGSIRRYWPGLAEPSLGDLSARWAGNRPLAAITFYRALAQSGQTATIDALIEALDQAGLDALPVYAQSLKEATAAGIVASLRLWA